MTKPYIVKHVDWQRVNDAGVPLDFLDVMEYFNRMLEKDAYPLIPRSEPITYEEISEKWVPSANTNVTYLTVDRKTRKVVCSGTLFVDSSIKEGELSITKDLAYEVKDVGTDVTRYIITEALSEGITVNVHTSVENEAMIRVMEKVRGLPTTRLHDYDKYKGEIRASNFDAFEWVIRP